MLPVASLDQTLVEKVVVFVAVVFTFAVVFFGDASVSFVCDVIVVDVIVGGSIRFGRVLVVGA